jgi:putative transposase
MAERLRERGHEVNRKRVQRLMRLMGLVGLAPRRSTSKPHPAHNKYPYLLRDVEIVRANQVWSTDITYIPMAHGFVYCVAIIDWHSRMVLSWRLSNINALKKSGAQIRSCNEEALALELEIARLSLHPRG